MRILLLIAFLSLLNVAHAQQEKATAQEQETTRTAPGKLYGSGSFEWIFSVPVLDVNGSDKGGVVRFSPFFNAQWMLNYDFSNHFGFFTGFSIRNQGFIYQVPDTSLRLKFRTYNVGVPVGFKLGRMNKALFFAGYELELPFNYKEKRFENERKEDKFSVWFSDRNTDLFQSVFVGIQGPGSTTLTVRYYLTNFHNQDFTESKDGVTSKPYAGLNANILAFSLGYALFDGTKVTRQIQPKSERDRQVMR